MEPILPGQRLRLVRQPSGGGELAAPGKHLGPGCPPPGLGVAAGLVHVSSLWPV
jgi:hypothetical protein